MPVTFYEYTCLRCQETSRPRSTRPGSSLITAALIVLGVAGAAVAVPLVAVAAGLVPAITPLTPEEVAAYELPAEPTWLSHYKRWSS